MQGAVANQARQLPAWGNLKKERQARSLFPNLDQRSLRFQSFRERIERLERLEKPERPERFYSVMAGHTDPPAAGGGENGRPRGIHSS
jgi:hypothetical protein